MPTLPERVSKPLVLIWVLLALCLPRVGIASPIFAVGDVHGAYQELLSVLTTAQLVDENENWRGGSARLVTFFT